MNSYFSIPILPRAPSDYERRYFDHLVSELRQVLQDIRARGDIIGSTIKASGTITSDTEVKGGILSIWLPVGDETTAITTGTAKATWRAPYAMTLSEVRASLTGASASAGPFTVDINVNGSTIMTTNKLTIDDTEKTSKTAATAAVLTTTAIPDDAEITIDVDDAGDGNATGLKVYLIGKKD